MKKQLIALILLVSTVGVQAQVRGKRQATTIVRPTVSTIEDGSASKLPIRRVILYSNGVAYVERRGIVSGNAEVNLAFKQSQVDDVLKSMIVLDLGQGKIGAVSYNSSAPISSRMSEIPFSVDAVSSNGGGISTVLSQLQGAKVAVVSTKGAATGSILTIERKQITVDKETQTTSLLVIASEAGEISTFDLRDVKSVKLLEDGTRKDVNEFANATASARRLDAKTITVTSQGTGSREMVVSYTIAAPIWKTTYRVVLDQEGKPFFQGWAIVDNVSEEDWRGVQMSLVSGSPISFIQNLQKPFYRYRPVVPTPSDLQLEPQIYEPQSGLGSGTGSGNGIGDGDSGSAITGKVTDANGAVVPGANVTFRNTSTGQSYYDTTDSDGDFESDDLPAGNYSVTIASRGFKTSVISGVFPGRSLRARLEVGSVSETVTVTGGFTVDGASRSENTFIADGQEVTNFKSGILSQTKVSDALTSGNSGISTAASGAEVGDLFQYNIEQPVTVERNRSALIPIVQAKMDGERVAIYNEAVRKDRPFSGVLLKNGTGLTLESGSMTVIDGNAYAGEALMERLKPKEQRLISFALDLGTSIRVRNTGNTEPAKVLKIVDGVLQVQYFRTDERTYEVSNQTDRPKVLYVEYPIRDGWELTEDSPKPDYSTQRYYRFRVELAGLEDKKLTIKMRQPTTESFQLTTLNRNDLQLFFSKGYINTETREQLEKIIDIRSQIAQIDGTLQSFDQEVRQIEDDQKRIRENIEALSKTPEAKVLIARYIAKANDQETRLEDIGKQRKTLDARKTQLQAELAAAIRRFTVK